MPLPLLILWIVLYVIAAILLIVTCYVFFIGAPFVPTPQAVVDKMIAAADLKPGMKVLDPGCGDGRMLISACKKFPDIQGVGYELFFVAYILGWLRTRKYKKNIKLLFRNSDYADLSDVDRIFCYMLPKPLARNAAKYKKELKKGAKIISYAFQIEGWKPEKTIPADSTRNHGPIYVYEI